MTALELVSGACLVAGAFFVVVGAIGFARLPDAYSRLHVTGVLDTAGAPLIMLGAAVHLGPTLVTLKLVLAMVFLSVTSPLVAHLLARAAVEAGHPPAADTDAAHLVGRGRADGGERDA